MEAINEHAQYILRIALIFTVYLCLLFSGIIFPYAYTPTSPTEPLTAYQWWINFIRVLLLFLSYFPSAFIEHSICQTFFDHTFTDPTNSRQVFHHCNQATGENIALDIIFFTCIVNRDYYS